MSRQVILDTETTGLSWQDGHRIVEIGCVEMLDRKLSRRNYHQYLNPQRQSDARALEVHGLTETFLSGQALFADVAEEFMEFVRDAELIIHNAPFDIGFLNSELKRAGHAPLTNRVIDTLVMAKEQNPGKKASLDALCERYDIPNGHRTLHGALLDAEILADVYLAMTRGQKNLLMLEEQVEQNQFSGAINKTDFRNTFVILLTEEELLLHQTYLDELDKESGGNCLWRKLG